MAIDFKGAHFPKSVILYAVFFYVRYPGSYRDLQEIMAERGVNVDHATLNRWVVRCAPQIADQAQKVRSKWIYLYRAVDRDGQTLDFMLAERRNLGAARRFFKKAIASNGVPDKIVIDKSGVNLAGAQAVNTILKITGHSKMIEILQVKYLNNILEQDHRFIKRITKHMSGFKAFHSASATIAGIEVAHMIRKKQFANDNRSPFEVFAQLAA